MLGKFDGIPLGIKLGMMLGLLLGILDGYSDGIEVGDIVGFVGNDDLPASLEVCPVVKFSGLEAQVTGENTSEGQLFIGSTGEKTP